MADRSRPLAIGVTGTDTGVGKTVTSCALIAALVARGLTVGALKPIETGIDDETRASDATDAAALRRATGDRDPYERVSPVTFEEPLAPWVAAYRSRRAVDFGKLDDAFAAVRDGRDAIVVEGAGGLLVPFDRTTTFADLATTWQLDLVVVAANRLGVINHTMLTLNEARRRGLAVRAVALNSLEDGVPGLAERTNVEALKALIAPVPLVQLPYLRNGARAWLSSLAGHGAPLADACVAR